MLPAVPRASRPRDSHRDAAVTLVEIDSAAAYYVCNEILSQSDRRLAGLAFGNSRIYTGPFLSQKIITGIAIIARRSGFIQISGFDIRAILIKFVKMPVISRRCRLPWPVRTFQCGLGPMCEHFPEAAGRTGHTPSVNIPQGQE